MNIPVLMYHGIHDTPGRDGRFDSVYSITRHQFEQQMRWLADNGYNTVVCSEINETPPDKKRIVITFDDGDLSNRTVSLPVLQELGMTAEYFITTDWIGTEDYMNPAQLRELEQAGMSLQSHAKSHRYLSDLTEEELTEELVGSKQALEQIIGRQVTGLALPGGRGGENVVQMAKQAGYHYVCNSEFGVNAAGTDPFALKRIAVTRQMGMEPFKRLVSGNKWELGRRLLRQQLLDSMKTVLGNRLYEKVRAGFLG